MMCCDHEGCDRPAVETTQDVVIVKSDYRGSVIEVKPDGDPISRCREHQREVPGKRRYRRRVEWIDDMPGQFSEEQDQLPF